MGQKNELTIGDGITVYNKNESEIWFSLDDICDTFYVDMNYIIKNLPKEMVMTSKDKEQTLVNEYGFFRAIFLVREYLNNLYASELLEMHKKFH